MKIGKDLDPSENNGTSKDVPYPTHIASGLDLLHLSNAARDAEFALMVLVPALLQFPMPSPLASGFDSSHTFRG